jgi:soluble lytic murein transglycosylase-like protein
MPQICLRRTVTPQPDRLNSSSFPVLSPAARSLPAAWLFLRPRSFLCVGVAALLLTGGGVAHAAPIATGQQNVVMAVDRFAAIVAEASERFGIPASWIRAVMKVESFGAARALSLKGAMGLMQIVPETWAALHSRYTLGTDPYDAHDNILAGAAYLRELHDRYGAPGFLAAYNAGPARYEDHLATGRPLPAETQAYVAALAPLIDGEVIDGAVVVSAAAPSWTDAPLFAVRAESRVTKSPASPDLRSGNSSADRTAEDWTGLAPQSKGLFVSTSRGNQQP